MRKISVALIVGIGLGLVTGPAAAKELHSAKICGRHKCAKLTAQEDLRIFAMANTPSDEPPSGPFYTVEMTVLDDVGEKHSWTIDYVPSSGLIRTTNEYGWAWYELDVDPIETGLSGLLLKLRPYPASGFRAAMDVAPGSFTRADLSDLPRELVSKPAPVAPPGNWGTSWPITVVLIFSAIVLASTALGLRLRRPRATNGTKSWAKP
jgi:hypothetical protein